MNRSFESPCFLVDLVLPLDLTSSKDLAVLTLHLFERKYTLIKVFLNCFSICKSIKKMPKFHHTILHFSYVPLTLFKQSRNRQSFNAGFSIKYIISLCYIRCPFKYIYSFCLSCYHKAFTCTFFTMVGHSSS